GGGRLTRVYSRSDAVTTRTAHHYLVFEVSKDKLAMRAVDIEGKVFDRIELEWRSPGEKESPGRPRREQSSPLDLPIAASPPR
ncbi:MAG TPA: hypothetical protein VFU21_20020, partial [Kofleriaceae bacterium]|nr:hypothetical protein [Kofleriaceae bacterium]